MAAFVTMSNEGESTSFGLKNACEECYQRKVKCLPCSDGSACQLCSRADRVCIFKPRKKPGRPRVKPVKSRSDSCTLSSSSTIHEQSTDHGEVTGLRDNKKPSKGPDSAACLDLYETLQFEDLASLWPLTSSQIHFELPSFDEVDTSGLPSQPSIEDFSPGLLDEEVVFIPEVSTNMSPLDTVTCHSVPPTPTKNSQLFRASLCSCAELQRGLDYLYSTTNVPSTIDSMGHVKKLAAIHSSLTTSIDLIREVTSGLPMDWTPSSPSLVTEWTLPASLPPSLCELRAPAPQDHVPRPIPSAPSLTAADAASFALICALAQKCLETYGMLCRMEQKLSPSRKFALLRFSEGISRLQVELQKLKAHDFIGWGVAAGVCQQAESMLAKLGLVESEERRG